MIILEMSLRDDSNCCRAKFSIGNYLISKRLSLEKLFCIKKARRQNIILYQARKIEVL